MGARTIADGTVPLRRPRAATLGASTVRTISERARAVAEGTRTIAVAVARTLVARFDLAARTLALEDRQVLVGGRRDDGDLLAGQLLDAAQRAALRRIAERQSRARGAS